jgi:AcrR family transcriptional regulator
MILPMGKIPVRTGPVNYAAETAGHRTAFANRRRDSDSKREAILHTAVKMFLDKSYSRTPLADVAEQLKITKPALYHYFRNKEEILLECYRLGLALIAQTLDEISALNEPGLAKVAAFIRAYTNLITIDFGRFVIRLDENELSSAARAQVRKFKREIDHRLRSLIAEGIEDGSIGPCDPKLAAFAIAGALNWIAAWYEPAGPLTVEEIASEFARILTQGLTRRTKGKRV